MSAADVVRGYIEAIERQDVEEVFRFVDAEGAYEEFPNRVFPLGRRATLSELRGAFEEGKALVRAQRYETVRIFESGPRAVAEVIWSATLADGRKLRAHSCQVFQVRDGRIVRQRNFDCYAPL
jgi:ketosteroid isomerase-like protein